jgi:hypothetical protein
VYFLGVIVSIEIADFEIIRHVRKLEQQPAVCAILGDCKHHYPASRTEFANETKFETIDTFDVNGNPTHLVDLNDDIPEEFHNRYDWVIDSGTLYCCFDVATVFKNIMKMVKVGGYVFHTGNLTGFYGRGYYSLSPALYSEIYPINGFEVKLIGTHTKKNRNRWQIMKPGNTYLQSADENELIFRSESSPFVPMIPNDSMICCLAKKVEEKEFTKPVPEHFIKTDGR